MSRSWIYLLLLLLLLSAKAGYAQDFPMLHYTVDDGLPSNTVYSVYTDSKGFLWIATDKGIARYNGIKFETFTTSNGLPDNEIFFFREDHNGRLWLATYNGELCFYQDDTFHTAANTNFLKIPFKASFINSIHVETDSSITISFYNCLKFLNIINNNCRIVNIFNGVNTTLFRGHLYKQKLSESQYIIITDTVKKNKIILDTTGKLVEQQMIKIKSDHDPYNYLRSTFNQTNTYIFNHHLLFDSTLKLIRPLDTTIAIHTYIHNIYHGNVGWLFATDHGVFINDSINILKDFNVSYISQDNNSNYAIATLGNGLYVLQNNFTKSYLCNAAYSNKIEYANCIGDHLFFVTPHKGNNAYTIKTIKKRQVQKIFDYEKDIPSDQKYSSAYFIDSNFRFYDCYNDHVEIINSLLSPVPKKKIVFFGLKPRYTFKKIISGNRSLYVQTKIAILKFNFANKTNNNIGISFLTDTNFFENIFDMCNQKNDNIWFSNNNNVYKLINDKVVSQPQFKDIAFKHFIFSGEYLVGYTHKNQLLICKNVDDKISIDSIANQNCIWEKIYALDSAHLLISTNNLFRLLTIFLGSNGPRYSIWAVENPFVPLQVESVCADSANCFFFKNQSITSIDIASILARPAPPKLLFNSLQAGKNIFSIRDDMQIPYRLSKNLTVLFSTLSFSSKNITYQFSAVSPDDSDVWREITGDALNLYNLGYGHHTIKLRAKSLSSSYSQPISFSLYILPPFWARWWFIVLCVCTLLLVIIAVIRIRIRYILVKNKKVHDAEVKFMKSEYKALNALMNPHFIFNTLNNVQSLVNDNNKLAANEYLRVFADLIRQNMHNVSKELIPIQKEIDLVANYLALEKLRFEDKLTYSINIDENIDLSDIMVPPLLIQPLVENAIKHGILPQKNRLGVITLNVYEREEKLYIEVQDNGGGIDTTDAKNKTLHESFGLDNISTRIQQLSIIQGKQITLDFREIKDGSGSIQGTLVTITMPVSE